MILGVEQASPIQAVIFVIGAALIAWGLYQGKAYEVGFVVIADPKRYEKRYYSVFRTFSYEKANRKLEELWEEVKKNGKEKVRKVRNV